MDGAGVLARLEQALNAHDLQLLVDCFDEQVVSEQPVHPSRAFRGRAQVEKNWAQLFAAFPDLDARLVRSVVASDSAMEPVEWEGAGIDAAIRERVSAA